MSGPPPGVCRGWPEGSPTSACSTRAATPTSLDRYNNLAAIVLVTWDAKSPDAAAASGQLAALAQEFQPKNVQCFAIDPAPRGDATADAARIEAAPAGNTALLKGASAFLGSLGVKTNATGGADAVPVLRDVAQVVTPALGVANAFEVLVLAPKDRAVLFQGSLSATGDALSRSLRPARGGGRRAVRVARPACAGRASCCAGLCERCRADSARQVRHLPPPRRRCAVCLQQL